METIDYLENPHEMLREFVFDTDKKDKNIKTFDVKITDKDLLKLSLTKEEDFYSNMKYDPRELEIVKKKRY